MSIDFSDVISTDPPGRPRRVSDVLDRKSEGASIDFSDVQPQSVNREIDFSDAPAPVEVSRSPVPASAPPLGSMRGKPAPPNSTTFGGRSLEDRLKRIREHNPAMADDAEEFVRESRARGFNPAIKSDVRDAWHQRWLHDNGYPTKGNDGFIQIGSHQLEKGARAIDWKMKGQPAAFQQFAREFAKSRGYSIPSDEPWHWTMPRGRAARPQSGGSSPRIDFSDFAAPEDISTPPSQAANFPHVPTGNPPESGQELPLARTSPHSNSIRVGDFPVTDTLPDESAKLEGLMQPGKPLTGQETIRPRVLLASNPGTAGVIINENANFDNESISASGREMKEILPPPIEFEPQTRKVNAATALSTKLASLAAVPGDENEDQAKPRKVSINTTGKQPSADEISDAFWRSYGADYEEANRRYRQETGRNLSYLNDQALQEVYSKGRKQGDVFETEVAPSRGLLKVMNAYVRGGLPAAEAEVAEQQKSRLEVVPGAYLSPEDQAKLQKAVDSGLPGYLKMAQDVFGDGKRYADKEAYGRAVRHIWKRERPEGGTLALRGAADAGLAVGETITNTGEVVKMGVAKYTGQDTPEFRKNLDETHYSNRAAFDEARASIPQEKTFTGKLLRGSISGAGELPIYIAGGAVAGPGGILVSSALRSFHKQPTEVIDDVLQSFTEIPFGAVGKGISAGMSTFKRKLADFVAGGTGEAMGNVITGDIDAQNLAQAFIIGGGFEVVDSDGKSEIARQGQATLYGPIIETEREDGSKAYQGLVQVEGDEGVRLMGISERDEILQKYKEKGLPFIPANIIEFDAALNDIGGKLIAPQEKSAVQSIAPKPLPPLAERKFDPSHSRMVVGDNGEQFNGTPYELPEAARMRLESAGKNPADYVYLVDEKGQSGYFHKRGIVTDTQPLPESEATLDAQVESARDEQSPRVAVFYPKSSEMPTSAPGFVRVPVDGGVLLVKRTKARAMGLGSIKQIQDYVTQNGFESLIGKVAPVEDTSQGVALRTEDADGNELSTSIVPTPEDARAQAEVDRAQFPQAAKQELMPAQEAVARRQVETSSPDTLTSAPLSYDAAEVNAKAKAKFEREQIRGRIPEFQSREKDEALSGLANADEKAAKALKTRARKYGATEAEIVAAQRGIDGAEQRPSDSRSIAEPSAAGSPADANRNLPRSEAADPVASQGSQSSGGSPVHAFSGTLREDGTAARQWQHAEFGLVEEDSSQSGIGAGRVRVFEVENPETRHVIQSSNGRGQGNNLSVPVRRRQGIKIKPKGAASNAQESGENQEAEARLSPPASGHTRFYRADRADATGPQGKGWARDPEYVSQKYGAGQMNGSESIWYTDVPDKVFLDDIGHVPAVTDRHQLDILGVKTEPKLFRRTQSQGQEKQTVEAQATPPTAATSSKAVAPAKPANASVQADAEWQQFPADSGSLNIPRASMPQIKGEHRGAMVQFLKARGITHTQEEVAPNTLKPSQAEFSPAKVDKARTFEGEQRSILISSDNHVLYGHHQWLSGLEDAPDTPIPAIRFNAPIHSVLLEAARFPSSGVDESSEGGSAKLPMSVISEEPEGAPKLAHNTMVRWTPIDKDEVNALPLEKRKRVIALIDEFNKSGYIDATLVLPDQWARTSERERRRRQATTSRVFEIEQEVKRLLKPEEQVQREAREAEISKARSDLAAAERRIEFIEGLGRMSHRPDGKLKAKYQRSVDAENRRRQEIFAEHPSLAASDTPAIKEQGQEEPTVADDSALYRAAVKAAVDLQSEGRAFSSAQLAGEFNLTREQAGTILIGLSEASKSERADPLRRLTSAKLKEYVAKATANPSEGDADAPTPVEAKASVKTEKVDKRTGLTPTQEEYLADKLEDYAEKHYISTDQYPSGKGKEEAVELIDGISKKVGQRVYSRAGQTETIEVPGDGEFTVSNVEQANRLHQKVTGAPIEGLPKEKGATVRTGTYQGRVPGSSATFGDYVKSIGGEREAFQKFKRLKARLESDPELAKDLDLSPEDVGRDLDTLRHRFDENRDHFKLHKKYLPEINRRLSDAKSFPTLKEAVDAQIRRQHGRGRERLEAAEAEIAAYTPEQYFEFDARNVSDRNSIHALSSARSDVRSEADIPYDWSRGVIDWFKVERQIEGDDYVDSLYLSDSPLKMADGGKSLDDLRDADFADIIQSATVARDNHLLEVNAEGHEILRRAFEQNLINRGEEEGDEESSFDGTFLNPQQIKETVKSLRAAAREMKEQNYSEEESQPLDTLARELIEAAKAGKGTAIAYVFDEAIPHEEFHRAGFQGAINNALSSRHARFNELAAHPAINQAWNAYFNRVPGYSRFDEALLVEETAAWIAGGRFETIGLTEDEAADYLRLWMDSYAEKNGEDSLNQFVEVSLPHVKTIIGQVREGRSDARRASAGAESGNRSEASGHRQVEGRAEPSDRGSSQEGSPEGEVKTRRTVLSAEAAGAVQSGAISGQARYYTVKSRDASEAKAQDLIEEVGLDAAITQALLPGEASAERTALRMEVSRLLGRQSIALRESNPEQSAARMRQAIDLVSSYAPEYTEYGQAISQLAKWTKIDPEVIVSYAQRKLSQRDPEAKLTDEQADALVVDAQALAEKEAKVATLRKKVINLQSRVRRLLDIKEPKRRQGARSPSRAGQKALRALEAQESELMARVRSALGTGAPLKMATVKSVSKSISPEAAVSVKSAKKPTSPITTEFRHWFGDSKVVNEKGEPLVVYHGSPSGSVSNREAQNRALVETVNHALRGAGKAELAADSIIRDKFTWLDTLNKLRTRRPELLPSEIDANVWREDKPFEVFDATKSGANTDAGDAALGFFFTADESFAGRFASRLWSDGYNDYLDSPRSGRVFPVYLSIKRPLRLDKYDVATEGCLLGLGHTSYRSLVRSVEGTASLKRFVARHLDAVKSQGFDGIFSKARKQEIRLGERITSSRSSVNSIGQGRVVDEIIAFEPTQIKSATGNRGTFDPTNPNILKMARAEGGVLTSDARPRLSPETLDDLARIGALKLMRGLPDARLTVQDWDAAMTADFGAHVKSYLPEIHAAAMRLRRELIREAREQAARERLRNEEGNEDLSDDELSDLAARQMQAQAAKRKIRGAHYKRARQFDSENKVSPLAEKIIESGSDERTTEAALRFTRPNAHRNEVIRELRRAHRLPVADADRLAIEGYQLYIESKKALEQERGEAKGETAETREALRQSKSEAAQAKRGLLRKLEEIEKGGPGAFRRLNNLFRGIIVSALQTSVRNIQTQIPRVGIEAATDAMEVAFNKVLRQAGLPVASDALPEGMTMLDAIKPLTFLIHRNKQIAEDILGDHPQLYEELLGALGDYKLPSATKTGKVVDSVLRKAERGVEAVNFMNRWQEFTTRRAVFMGTLYARMKSRGVDIFDLVENDRAAEIPEAEIRIAVRKALQTTFAENPQNKDVASLVRILGSGPAPINPFTFSRFMYNAAKFTFEYSPASFIRGTYRSVKNREVESRDFVKGALGMMMLLVAAQVLDHFGGDDDKWYTLRIPFTNTIVDVRPYFPFAAYYFMAHAVKRINQGRKPFSNAGEAAEGLLGFNQFENPMWEIIKGMPEILRGDESAKQKAWTMFQKLLGNTTGALFTPLKTAKDIIAQFNKEERIVRDYTDEPFMGGIKRNLPFTSRGSKARIDPASGEPLEQENPILKPLAGLRVLGESELRPAQSKAEELANDLRSEQMPDKPRTPAQKDASRITGRLKTAARKGVEIESRLQQFVERGTLTVRQADGVRASAQLSPLQEDVKALPLPDAERVYQIASPEEKKSLDEIMLAKRLNKAEADAREEERLANPERAEILRERAQRATEKKRQRQELRYGDRLPTFNVSP